MSSIELSVEGIGFWASGLPDWDAARAFVIDGVLPANVAAKPAPQLLAPNERRRAPDSVALALEVAQSACAMAGRDPRTLASVFASTHGDLAITDYICDTLAGAPETLSPTKFHNSVHNAAAGYWTIGTGCMAATTAISAYDCSFAQGMLEAATQSREAGGPILLVVYDGESRGPLGEIAFSRGLLAGALILNADVTGHEVDGGARKLRLSLRTNATQIPGGALHARYAGNAMAQMLPLFEALVHTRAASIAVRASPRQSLRVDVSEADR
jgi:hypothetical protein